MKAQTISLFLIGAAIQALALFSFCMFAREYPETPLKVFGFVILSVGHWFVLRRVFLLPTSCIFLVIVSLSCVAPLVLLAASSVFPGLAKDMVLFSSEHVGKLVASAGLAFACYVLVWLSWLILKKPEHLRS